MSLPKDHSIRGLASLRETDLDDINLVESEFFRWTYEWNNEFAKEKYVPESLPEAIKKLDMVVFLNLH